MAAGPAFSAWQALARGAMIRAPWPTTPSAGCPRRSRRRDRAEEGLAARSRRCGARSHRASEAPQRLLPGRSRGRPAGRAGGRARAGRPAPTLGPLHGVPFSVKDLVITKGVRTTFGTPLYRDNVPTEDAPSCRADEGGRRDHARQDQHADVRLGRRRPTTSLFGITRNPWNLDRTPGGSSGRRRRRRRRRARARCTSAPTAAARSASRPSLLRASTASSPRTGACRSIRLSGAVEPLARRADDAHGGRRRAHAAA